MQWISDLIGTLRNTFKIGSKATLDASAASAARTYTLPDASGNVVLGPGSSTDRAIAVFDGTGGDTLANSTTRIFADGSILSDITHTAANTEYCGRATSLYYSGTVSAGFGYEERYCVQDDSGTAYQAASFHIVLEVAATSTHRYSMAAEVVDGGNEWVLWKGCGNGSAPQIGFLGAAWSPRLASPDVGTALVTFGLASGTPTFAAANLTGWTVCEFRPTTESGVAVSASDRTSQGTIYLTPRNGNRIGLYDGSVWRVFALPEFALPLTMTSGKNYDLFAFFTTAAPSGTNTGTDIITFGSAQGWATGSVVTVAATGGGLTAGTNYYWNAASSTTGSFHTTLANALAGSSKVDLTASITANVTGVSLELSAAWTNNTTRADALTTQDGVSVKSGATTRRRVGRVRASGTNVTEDSNAKRFVGSLYNKVPRKLKRADTTDTYDTTSTSLTAWLNNAGNIVEWFADEDDEVELLFLGSMRNSTAGLNMGVAIGVDTTSGNSADSGALIGQPVSGVGIVAVAAHYKSTPGIGYHYAAMLAIGSGGTTRHCGDNGNTADFGCAGLTGHVMG